ncbi:MAG: helix-turn-helix domain-containing protein [Bacteroidales bacterium]|nr:helix-turn-helix domain-containing protein [Bacteroidales bacterium]
MICTSGGYAVQNPVHDTISIPYAKNEINIDGELDDWKKYAGRIFCDTFSFPHHTPDYFIFELYPEDFDTASIRKPLSKNAIEVLMCWDLDYLYFGFDVKDKHLFAQVDKDIKASEIYLNDAMEIYLDTQKDSEERMDINDYQFIIDILNQSVVFRGDYEKMKVDTFVVPKAQGQNVYFESATSFFGDINSPLKKDEGYIMEVAIPWLAIGVTPEEGHWLKIDVGCEDMDYSLVDLRQTIETTYITWPFNWVGYGDFGFPKYWKPAVLTGHPGWIERVSEKYKNAWAKIFIGMIVITLLVITGLYFYIRKLQRLPQRQEVADSPLIQAGSKKVVQKNTLTEYQEILQQAFNYIKEYKGKMLRSEEVARGIGLSLRNFQRVTREELGCTPTNYIYIVKLQLAAEYLTSNEGNVSQAAYDHGFADPSYFSKLFKKHYGLSPVEYLEKMDK